MNLHYILSEICCSMLHKMYTNFFNMHHIWNRVSSIYWHLIYVTLYVLPLHDRAFSHTTRYAAYLALMCDLNFDSVSNVTMGVVYQFSRPGKQWIYLKPLQIWPYTGNLPPTQFFEVLKIGAFTWVVAGYCCNLLTFVAIFWWGDINRVYLYPPV